jgi:hypothetical protein
MLLCLLSQSVLDFNKITACFEKVIKENHKTKFEHWYYDLSFKSSVSVAIFTLGLFFSVMLPLLVLLILTLICV